MTVIYVPRLIESAEQAEALPEGTVVKRARKDGIPEVAIKYDDDADGESWLGTLDRYWSDHMMVGWTALVPIEAEEGTDTIQTGAEHSYTRTRYVTPWEEA